MDGFQNWFSLILVVATVIYVYFTYKLVLEARKSREIGLKPHIILYLDNAEASPSSIFLNVKNIGSGVAVNVTFQVTKDFNPTTSYDKKLLERRFLSKKYSYFPPQYRMKNYLFSFSNDNEAKKKDSVVVKCNYSDIFNKKYEEIFELRFKDGLTTTKHTPPENYIGLISYRLEKIEKTLEKINFNLEKDENENF